FFVDGVHDEILTDLARIADLKVISRTSVMQYKTGARRNLREIARELRVAHIVEGSVQRAGNRVRVRAQLIDARNDVHLWADRYDRPLDDVFAIQSEIAKAIADQLQATLSPAEKAAIEQAPTADLIAYDRYLRGKKLLGQSSYDTRTIDNIRQAIRLLEQAVAYDPGFYLAHCQLAHARGSLYFSGADHTPTRVAQARQALQKALSLAPDRGEGHLTAAWISYHCDRDSAEIARALASIPAEGIVPVNVRMPRSFCEGIAARSTGDDAAAASAFTSAGTEMARLLHEQPDYGEALSVLAMSEAALGRKED